MQRRLYWRRPPWRGVTRFVCCCCWSIVCRPLLEITHKSTGHGLPNEDKHAKQMWNKKLKANSCGIWAILVPLVLVILIVSPPPKRSPGIWNRLMIYRNSLNQPFQILLPAFYPFEKSWLFDVPTTISGTSRNIPALFNKGLILSPSMFRPLSSILYGKERFHFWILSFSHESDRGRGMLNIKKALVWLTVGSSWAPFIAPQMTVDGYPLRLPVYLTFCDRFLPCCQYHWRTEHISTSAHLTFLMPLVPLPCSRC